MSSKNITYKNKAMGISSRVQHRACIQYILAYMFRGKISREKKYWKGRKVGRPQMIAFSFSFLYLIEIALIFPISRFLSFPEFDHDTCHVAFLLFLSSKCDRRLLSVKGPFLALGIKLIGQ